MERTWGTSGGLEARGLGGGCRRPTSSGAWEGVPGTPSVAAGSRGVANGGEGTATPVRDRPIRFRAIHGMAHAVCRMPHSMIRPVSVIRRGDNWAEPLAVCLHRGGPASLSYTLRSVDMFCAHQGMGIASFSFPRELRDV